MRSLGDYIITKDEVHGYADHWLSSALRLEYEGTKCTASTLIQVLLIAAARAVSLYAACRDLADAPTDQTIRGALHAALPGMTELEQRLNRALATELPKALRRKGRIVAIDLTLIPYHGQPLENEREIYRSSPKSGTTHFHAYATAVVVHKGHRYTLALTHVERGEAMKDVVQRLLRVIRRRNVRIKFLLLDKGFFNVETLAYLRRSGHGFIVPAVPRGRKPKRGKKATGLRALLKQKHGYYEHTLTRQAAGKKNQRMRLTICVAAKSYKHRKSGHRRRKNLLYAVYKVRLSPREIRETYRKRFGIETSYRQMNEARIRTCTRDPRLRLLFVGVALVLRNVWVWLHFKLAKGKWNDEPQLFLQLLRFNEMLLWITQMVQRLLHADHQPGIDLETYARLTESG
jgi:putative transposase